MIRHKKCLVNSPGSFGALSPDQKVTPSQMQTRFVSVARVGSAYETPGRDCHKSNTGETVKRMPGTAHVVDHAQGCVLVHSLLAARLAATGQ